MAYFPEITSSIRLRASLDSQAIVGVLLRVTGGAEVPATHNRLTEVAIRAARPRQRAYRLSDGGGLHMYVTSEGGRWWRVRYRWKGLEQTLSLGTYPEIGLKTARARRDTACQQLAHGIKPTRDWSVGPSEPRTRSRQWPSNGSRCAGRTWKRANCPQPQWSGIEGNSPAGWFRIWAIARSATSRRLI